MEGIFRRTNQFLLFAVLTVVVMYYARVLLLPVVFAALFAMLTAPICRWLDSRGLNRAFSSLICVFVILLAILIIAGITVVQIFVFAQDISSIEQKVLDYIAQLQEYIEHQFGIHPEKQEDIAKEQARSSGQAVTGFLTRMVGGMASALAGIVLSLVLTFLLLFNKEKYETFFVRLYHEEDPEKVKDIVSRIGRVSQEYLTGKAISILVLAILYSVGLLIVGVKSAILLGLVAALLTVIPYVGTVLGGVFPVVMALLTEDGYQTAFWAAVVVIFIQTIDNYFIEPYVVGGQVNLNAITSILSIIAGGLVWGIAGMIVFLPLTGFVKIVCDNVENLKPIVLLLGDTPDQKPSKIKDWIMRRWKSIKN